MSAYKFLCRKHLRCIEFIPVHSQDIYNESDSTISAIVLKFLNYIPKMCIEYWEKCARFAPVFQACPFYIVVQFFKNITSNIAKNQTKIHLIKQKLPWARTQPPPPIQPPHCHSLDFINRHRDRYRYSCTRQ